MGLLVRLQTFHCTFSTPWRRKYRFQSKESINVECVNQIDANKLWMILAVIVFFFAISLPVFYPGPRAMCTFAFVNLIEYAYRTLRLPAYLIPSHFVISQNLTLQLKYSHLHTDFFVPKTAEKKTHHLLRMFEKRAPFLVNTKLQFKTGSLWLASHRNKYHLPHGSLQFKCTPREISLAIIRCRFVVCSCYKSFPCHAANV